MKQSVKKHFLSWAFLASVLVVTWGLTGLKGPVERKIHPGKEQTLADLARERAEKKKARRLSGWVKPDRPHGFMEYEILPR